jgi:hypothetical protein
MDKGRCALIVEVLVEISAEHCIVHKKSESVKHLSV